MKAIIKNNYLLRKGTLKGSVNFLGIDFSCFKVISYYMFCGIMLIISEVMMKEKENQFLENLKNHNLELNEQQKQQFKIYAEMLIEWNQKMNLTAIANKEDIYEKHFLDCILMSYAIDMEGSLCDVGSGAGFPSIPLKIVYPKLKVWIVEPLQKRCTFLNALVNALGLQDVTIVNARAEDYIKEKREFYDIVSARAVANLTMLAELCIPFVRREGVFVAMKGPNIDSELEDARGALKVLGGVVESVDFQDLNTQIRNNLVIRKIGTTPKKYPRAFGQIKKNPLRSM